MEKMVKFEAKHTKVLDQFFPPGSKREIWWVTEKSLDRECVACGKCCAMIGLMYPMHVMEEMAKGTADPDLRFVIENLVPIPDDEAAKRGACPQTHFHICRNLTMEGLCSIHDDKPGMCRRHPVLGQSVVGECIFAGTSNFGKSPRGVWTKEIKGAFKHLKAVCTGRDSSAEKNNLLREPKR